MSSIKPRRLTYPAGGRQPLGLCPGEALQVPLREVPHPGLFQRIFWRAWALPVPGWHLGCLDIQFTNPAPESAETRTEAALCPAAENFRTRDAPRSAARRIVAALRAGRQPMGSLEEDVIQHVTRTHSKP